MLPEYGVAYVKNVRFFKQPTNEYCLTDLIVAACKCNLSLFVKYISLKEVTLVT